ncbi:MAG: hypothetical protein Q4C65_09940 [Eubacteriales bacterium]|nr:hypothetical protein [Eubacteriales bacterium]
MYPASIFPESDKPFDMAENSVLSPDGVNPVAKNSERPGETDVPEEIPPVVLPGAFPPAYFPGFPNGPV